MRHLNFDSCAVNPNVWMIPVLKDYVSEYYEYFMLYTDYTLVISENIEYLLREQIVKYFDPKEDSIGPPENYLGGRLCKVDLGKSVKECMFGLPNMSGPLLIMFKDI